MSKVERYPSYAACVAQALSSSQQPLSVDGLLTEVANQRPLGKGARSAVYRAINKLFQAVPVGPGRYGWLSHLLTGTRFRHPLTGEEIRRGFLLLDELEHIVFFPQFFQSNKPDDRVLTIDLFGGPTIQAEASIERKTWSLRLGPEFTAWIDELGGQSRDDLLISVEEASEGRYAFRLNLREMRDERSIRNRNIQLALMAEDLVAENRRARQAMPTWELIARLVGRGVFAELPPTDDLHYVLHEYSMLRYRDGVGYQLDPLDESQSAEQRTVALALPGTPDDDLDDGLDFDLPEEDDWSPMESESGSAGIGPDEECATYQTYLEAFYALDPSGQPLPHEDYHLLEAELEMLVRLEQEFGRLLPEQAERQEQLSLLLFIDPNEFVESDWDTPEDPDADNPPFWAN